MSQFRSLLACFILAPLALAAAQQPQHSASQALATQSPGGDTTATPAAAVRWIHLQPDRDAKVGMLQSIQAQVAKARAERRTPFLEIGTTWCSPCRALEANLKRPDIVDAFTGAYIIHVDPDDWKNPAQIHGYGKGNLGGAMPIIIALAKDGQPTDKLEEGWTAVNGNPKPLKAFIQAHAWKASKGAAPADSSGAPPARPDSTR